MTERYLADLEPGERVRTTVYVLERRRGVTRDNAPYAEIVVCDKTGRLTAHKWDLTESEWHTLSSSRFLSIVGRARLSKRPNATSRIEMTMESFQDASPVNVRDFLPEPRCNLLDQWQRLTELVRTVSDPDLKRLLRALFQDKGFRQSFCRAPGAQQRHHPYPGGLLEHSVEVAELGLAVCDRMPNLDQALVVTGALLHDIGKTREMRCDLPGFEFTPDGGLLGHVMLGADIIREALGDLPDFPDETRGRLLHLVLSHHGRREWGAPVEPATPEALLLHACDQISVQMFYCREAGRTATDDLFMWVPTLERRMYMGPRDARHGTAATHAGHAADDDAEGLPESPFTDDLWNLDDRSVRPTLTVVPGGLADVQDLPEMIALPIYGCIAAGAAIRTEQNLEGFRAVPVCGRRDMDDFLLRISGDSMRDAHILDGDIVRVRPHAEAREGDIVAALLNGDVTVKRFHQNADGITLQAENPAYSDIIVRQGDAFTIQGVVVGLLREFVS